MPGTFGSSGVPNNSWTVTASEYVIAGDTHDGTAVIDNLASTAALRVGLPVTGVGIGVSAKVLTVDSATQVTLDVVSTIDDTSVSITFDAQFVVPAGVTSIFVDLIGGGQQGSNGGTFGGLGGASAFGSYLSALGGGGVGKTPSASNGGMGTGGADITGGGGQYWQKRHISVTPAESIDITIGAGGTGGSGNNGGAGVCIVEWNQ